MKLSQNWLILYKSQSLSLLFVINLESPKNPFNKMKFAILFVVLFSSLIANVNTFEFKPPHMKSSGTDCEEVFNVNTCSECQQALWDSWTSESTCGFFIHLFENVKENTLKPLSILKFNRMTWVLIMML